MTILSTLKPNKNNIINIYMDDVIYINNELVNENYLGDDCRLYSINEDEDDLENIIKNMIEEYGVISTASYIKDLASASYYDFWQLDVYGYIQTITHDEAINAAFENITDYLHFEYGNDIIIKMH